MSRLTNLLSLAISVILLMPVTTSTGIEVLEARRLTNDDNVSYPSRIERRGSQHGGETTKGQPRSLVYDRFDWSRHRQRTYLRFVLAASVKTPHSANKTIPIVIGIPDVSGALKAVILLAFLERSS